MAYNKTTWSDLPSQTTPVNATNLNNIENGIKENDDRLNGTKSMSSIVVEDINGKNMFNPFSVIANTGVNNGVIFSTNDYDIYVIKVVPNKKYTISKTSYNGGLIGYYSTFPAIGNTITNMQTLRDVTTLTITAQDNYLCMMIAKADNIGTIQVELGETATSYVAYNQPIKNTSLGVKEDTIFYADDFKCKNLFTGFSNGTYDSSTGVYNPSGNGISTAKIPVKAGETYCLNGISGSPTIRLLYWNDGTYVTSETKTAVVNTTITPQGNYMAIQTSASATYSDVQLEIGTTATAYTPHKNFDGEVYSESEIKIGTWIDGKPIYRKIFETTNITSSNTDFINVPNVETPIRLYGILFSTTGNKFIMPSYDTSTNYNVIWWRSSSGYIRGRAVLGDGGSLQKCVIVFEYTKTTANRSLPLGGTEGGEEETR